jgi:NADPH-dependent 2,4-dienoyl-CoA reductase/sulfur reductase-like enzyme
MLNHRSIIGARSRRFAAVPSNLRAPLPLRRLPAVAFAKAGPAPSRYGWQAGCSLKLASLRGRFAGRSIPLATFFAAFVLSVVAGGWSGARPDADARHAFDVVIYGGTAGGVIAAVAAAREGLNVALVTPDRHLGGMVSGGLGWTDYGRKEVIGCSRDIFPLWRPRSSGP